MALALSEASEDLSLAKSELIDHAFCVSPLEGASELRDESVLYCDPPEAHLWEAIDIRGRERLDKFLARETIQLEIRLCDQLVTHESRRDNVLEAAARALDRLDALGDDSTETDVEEILHLFSNETGDIHLWDCDLTDEEYLLEWGPEEDYEGSTERARELAPILLS